MADPLFPHLITRSVDRRRYRLSRLEQDEKRALEESVGGELVLHWAESIVERWRWAKINAMATKLRMSIPEAFDIHRRILDWDRSYSPFGVPAAAVGVDPLTQRLMRWAMGDWSRMHAMNRYLNGTLVARLELDLIPGVICGAHCYFESRSHGHGQDRSHTLIDAGMALQRLWLTADKLSLVMQPSLAPLAFASYARSGVKFTDSGSARAMAMRLDSALSVTVTPTDPANILFLARMGRPIRRRARARSVRLPFDDLLVGGSSTGQ